MRPLAMRAEQKGLEVVCHVLPSVPSVVVGDPGRLRLVIVNLVGNAIKFTERGQILVQADVESVGEREAVLHYIVSDSGMPDAMLARVGGDRSLLTEMIRLFADDAPHSLDRIRASIDARDAAALQRAAHALKGAAANFEATDVVRAARALEEIGQAGRIDDAASPWRRQTTEMDRLMARLTSMAT